MFKVLETWKKDEEGGTLVFVGVCLTLLLGFTALTFDLGRVAATQSDMQSFADHIALSAAGELDGKPDAITRATAAAAELVTAGATPDRATFSQVSADVAQELNNTDYTLFFLKDIPEDDRDTFDHTASQYRAADANEATMVLVETSQRTVFLPFFRAFSVLMGNEPSDGSAQARAIAGYTQYACDVTTLMFCLPQDHDLFEGQSILLRTGGQGSAWGAGDFGFVDPTSFAVDPNGPCAGLTGVNLDTCLIAASGNRTRCFAQRGIDLEPGQKTGITNAVFNTRFDMFNGVMSNKKNDPAYAPGPHVVTGLTSTGGGQCLAANTEASPDTMAFPPDDCFGSALGCPNGGGRFGDGNWDNGRDTYVDINYGTPSGASGTSDPFAAASTRFEYYKAEVENAGASGNILTGRSENGRPQCSQHQSDDVNRRVFIAAGINCDPSNGGMEVNGAETNVPVAQYFEVFLLRPVGEGSGSPAAFDLHVEVIGPAGGDGTGNSEEAGIFRNVVELLR
jgi:hypothetical protein